MKTKTTRAVTDVETRIAMAMAQSGTAKMLVMLILFFAVPAAILLTRASAASDALAGHADDASLKQVVAGFSNGWNMHDAKTMCAALADDVQWVSWRGDVSGSRQKVQDDHAALFAGLYKNTHRMDAVKAIHYLGPDLASVDDYWTMTGAKTREGDDWPYREGYASFLMARRGGRWVIIISHTADFNAKAPGVKP